MILPTLRIGTRGSKLALWQAHHVADLLQHMGVPTEIVVIETKGDKILDRSLAKIGSKGVFTEELEEALRSGDIHIAQHSAKDVQSQLPNDLELIAFTRREKVNDVVLSTDTQFSLATPGQRIGTSSVRRVAFFKKYYPHLEVVDMRGNLQTRLEKLKNGHCDALALAYAGVHRMGYENLIVAELPIDQFTPPVGQGSVAIEASKKLPAPIKQLIRAALNDETTEACLIAERAFLARLEGGCSIPAFCLAQLQNNDITIRAGLIATDGSRTIEVQKTGKKEEGPAIGEALAQKILESGGKELLLEIRQRQAS